MFSVIKRLLCISCCIAGLLSCCSCDMGSTGQTADLEAPEATGEFNVSVLNVGKADAIVLRTENHTVLIDTGNRGDGKKILDYLSEYNITDVDYLFITHFDKDHVGGAVKLINNLQIGEIVAPKYKGSCSEYTRYISALEDNSKKQFILTSKMSFILDDVLFEAYPPKKNAYDEADNDFSIVVSITHGDNTFLFAGDAEEERLSELPSQMEMQHTFLKVPHHGKIEKNSEEFLGLVNPKYAVITCSAEEPCDDEVIELLESMGTEVFLTANGQVDVVSDGKNLTINQKN